MIGDHPDGNITMPKQLVWLLAVLVFCAIGAIGLLANIALRPLTDQGDEAIVARTVKGAALRLHASQSEVLRHDFPVTMHLSDRDCVALKPKRVSLGGGYLACYRRGDGALIEEIQRGPAF